MWVGVARRRLLCAIGLAVTSGSVVGVRWMAQSKDDYKERSELTDAVGAAQRYNGISPWPLLAPQLAPLML